MLADGGLRPRLRLNHFGEPESACYKSSLLRETTSKMRCMNVQIAVLCDAATDDNGKLNLLGAFDTIFARELPAIHPQCTVALRVTFFSSDEGKRQLKLNFVDADGHSIMPSIDIPVEVALPEDVHFGTRNLIVNIQKLKFDEPGLYALDIVLDDQSRANIPLLVKLASPQPSDT